MIGRRLVLRLLFWLAVSMVVTWPASLSPGSLLVGHPDVDVWNHAWGYWFVPHAISNLEFPFSTSLIGIPDGGDLYFIDFIGAILGAPLAWVFGPAVAYNGVMILRIALAGLAGQVLAETVLGRGVHCVVAGFGLVSLPFLLCEMSNGISEVIAIHWIPWTLAAGWQAWTAPTRRRWMMFGLLLGVTTSANFYYGLVTVMCAGVWMLAESLPALKSGLRPSLKQLGDPARGVAVAVAVAMPFWLAFQWTLHSANALIVRPKELAVGWILSHNAVDPRTYFVPGDFQSVDLTTYGEAFVHTGYLRWTILALAAVGLLRDSRMRSWGWAALVSLVVGLGPVLFIGEWVKLGGHAVSLPFYWAQQVLPDVAITHPLRLSIGGQIILTLMAAAGAAALQWRGLALLAGLAIMVESLSFSPGPWPVPTSPASVPEVYTSIPPGPILDLPGSVGATMATSRYFWYQTAHEQPIPYSPNVRLDSCRDMEVQSAFTDPHLREAKHQVVEHPAKGPDLYQKALAKRYSAIVLHKDLEGRANLLSAYAPVLESVFGPPDIDGDVMVWTVGEAP
jgi:hypothetical protein